MCFADACCFHNQCEPSIVLQVKRNVAAAKEALGLAQAQDESKDKEILQEVERILQPIKNQTWPSGRPQNSQE